MATCCTSATTPGPQEFALYDEYNPMVKILVNGNEFFLNFDHTERTADDRRHTDQRQH